MVCILLNTIVLAMSWYGESATVTKFTTLANFVFMGIFTIEAFIKIVAMKSSYFKDSWNIFDFVVVVFTPIVIVISLFPQLGIDAKKQATLLRVLRMLRILRIVKKAEKLQIIFETILEAIPAMGSLGVLLLLFLFLFSIIGMQLFSFVTLQSDLDVHANF